MIPGYPGTGCRPVLVGLCYDQDDFNARMRQIIAHAGITCHDKTKLVLIFTTQWNAKVWRDVYQDLFMEAPALVAVFMISADRRVARFI